MTDDQRTPQDARPDHADSVVLGYGLGIQFLLVGLLWGLGRNLAGLLAPTTTVRLPFDSLAVLVSLVLGVSLARTLLDVGVDRRREVWVGSAQAFGVTGLAMAGWLLGTGSLGHGARAVAWLVGLPVGVWVGFNEPLRRYWAGRQSPARR